MEKKKDYSLLKIVLIPLLIYMVLTWFIPTGSFSGSEFIKGEVTSLGIYGLFTSPLYSFAILVQNVFLILCIGGFYGVLNKTGAYQRVIEFLAKDYKEALLIITVVIFALLSSLFGSTMFVKLQESSPLLFSGSMLAFILLPFFISVLVKAGYSRVSSMAATIGATLVGIVASTSSNLPLYKIFQFNFDSKVYVIYNAILLGLLMFLLCMFIITKDKKETNKKELVKDIPLYEVSRGKKNSAAPLVIILISVLLLVIVGGYDWNFSYDFKGFTNFHELVTGFELFKINIFTRIFGNFSGLGSFTVFDISALLIISSLLIAWVYGVKIDETIESFKNGAKEMLLPSIYIVLASVVFTQSLMNSGGTIFMTIINPILKLFKEFNVFTGTLTGILGSCFYSDPLYFVNGLYGIISTFDSTKLPLILTVFQSSFGIMMFVLPVSILLIGGLKFLSVSYKEWIKYIWKFLLQVFVISIIGNIILSMII